MTGMTYWLKPHAFEVTTNQWFKLPLYVQESVIKLVERAEQAEARVAALEAAAPLLDELRRAEAKHPAWPSDPIHMAAIVAEETLELVQAAFQATYEGGAPERIDTEAVHVGAMALRLLKHRAALRGEEPA